MNDNNVKNHLSGPVWEYEATERLLWECKATEKLLLIDDNQVIATVFQSMPLLYWKWSFIPIDLSGLAYTKEDAIKIVETLLRKTTGAFCAVESVTTNL